MLQFDGGQAQTSDDFPAWPGPGLVTSVAVLPVLGPTQMGRGVLLSTYNNLTDLQLAYRDEQSSGWAWREGTIVQGIYPGSFVFPKAIGLRLRNHNAGAVAQAIAQVWEIDDGPLPQSPLSSNSATLSPSGFIGPSIGAAMQLINTITLSVNGPEISFQAIPQTFRHLYIVGSLTTVSGTPWPIQCVLNNSFSPGYFVQEIQGGIAAGASPTAQNATSATSWRVGEVGSTAWGALEMTLPNYASTVIQPTFFSRTTAWDNTTPWTSISSGFDNALAATVSVTVFPFGGVNFAANSSLSLYGLPG
jgi:hypothetical protein